MGLEFVLLELGAQLDVVVDLSIDTQDDLLIVADQRLCTRV